MFWPWKVAPPTRWLSPSDDQDDVEPGHRAGLVFEGPLLDIEHAGRALMRRTQVEQHAPRTLARRSRWRGSVEAYA